MSPRSSLIVTVRDTKGWAVNPGKAQDLDAPPTPQKGLNCDSEVTGRDNLGLGGLALDTLISLKHILEMFFPPANTNENCFEKTGEEYRM